MQTSEESGQRETATRVEGENKKMTLRAKMPVRVKNVKARLGKKTSFRVKDAKVRLEEMDRVKKTKMRQFTYFRKGHSKKTLKLN